MSEPILLSEWLEVSGCPRSTAYELLKLAGIEPGKAKVPGSRRPVSELNGEQREQLEWLWNQRRAGAGKDELLRQIAQARGLDPDHLETSADGLGTSRDDLETTPDGAALAARNAAVVAAIESATERIATKAIAVAVANTKPSRAPIDPLRQAKLLSEAAQLEWLSKAEAARVLGLSQTVLDGLEWPHQPRPGYRVERAEFDGVGWFRVVRVGSGLPSGMSGGGGGGGFFGMAELAACHAIASARVVELPLLPG